jgi:hypothetical protein
LRGFNTEADVVGIFQNLAQSATSPVTRSPVPGGQGPATRPLEAPGRSALDVNQTLTPGKAATLPLPDPARSSGVTPGFVKRLLDLADGHARKTVSRDEDFTRANQAIQSFRESEISHCKAELTSKGESVENGRCWGTRRDGDVAERANAIMARLAGRQPDQPYPIEVLVQQRREMNASAWGGGKILLSRDIAETHDDDMLAFVLAHELAHDRHLDSAASISRMEVYGAIARGEVLSDESSSLKLEFVGENAAIQRQQELAADAEAVRMMARSGFDPQAALRSLDTLSRGHDPDAPEMFDATHPAPGNRRAAVEKIIESEGLDAIYQQNRPR